jgi:hypothetical protein
MSKRWMPRTIDDAPDRLILFDGVCVLCSWWVRFVIERDTGARFHRAATARLGVDRGRLNFAVLERGLGHVIAPVVTCSVRKRVRSSLISVGRSC